jgi:hypothetical protein
MTDGNNIRSLRTELSAVIRKIARYNRILRLSRLITYGLSFLYFVFILYTTFSSGSAFLQDKESDPRPAFPEANRVIVFLIPAFLLITLGGFLTSFLYGRCFTMEKETVKRIIGELFPEAQCALETAVMPYEKLQESLFFDGLSAAAGRSAVSYGSLAVMRNGKRFTVHDVGIMASKGRTPAGRYADIMYRVFRLATASRMDGAMYHFRGLFGYADLGTKINGSVILLPDHLECHLDYMAQTLQAMKNINGNKSVVLENPEFERYFAVYSTDEILARYILTPAVMERMTALRQKYRRDIMMSFTGNRFYFAVSMPEGFLTLGKNTGSSGAVGDLYDNVDAALSVMQDLRLQEKRDGFY